MSFIYSHYYRDLSDNQLVGNIPQDVNKMNALQVLYVSKSKGLAIPNGNNERLDHVYS